MTTKTLTGTYASGYYLHAPTRILSITSSAYLQGNLTMGGSRFGFSIANAGQVDAISITARTTLTNTGAIVGGYPAVPAISFAAPAVIVNGAAADTSASIFEIYGAAGQSAMITNFAIIDGDVGVNVDGGTIVNGSSGDTAALIGGADEGVLARSSPASVTNFGGIGFGDGAGSLGAGVALQDGGSVVNGASADRTATIESHYYGVKVGGAAGSVVNFGLIDAVTGKNSDYLVTSVGVLLGAGGTITNGSQADTTARITADYGVETQAVAAAVTNFGRIFGQFYRGYGVEMAAGGILVNGGADDAGALISGVDGGVVLGAEGTVSNFGAITAALGDYGDGVLLKAGGRVVNGSAADTTAIISGFDGLVAQGVTPATITNFGRIEGPGGYGVQLTGGGSLTNGSATDTRASIEGYAGLELADARATNFGVIQGSAGVGVTIGGHSSLTNGSTSDHAALIEGTTGAALAGVGSANTLINFGTVEGSGGTAVSLSGPEARLLLEAGCAFEGAVIGGGGVLVLDAPAAVIALPSTTSIVVSGNMTAATFTGFGELDIDVKSTAALSGAASVANMALNVEGSLSVASALTLTGGSALLVDAGALSGVGALAIKGGQATFDAGAALSIAKVSLTGATGQANIGAGAALAYAGTWSQSAGTLNVGSGGTLSFSGTGDILAGTLAGAGAIVIAAGQDTLRTASVGARLTVAEGATLTLQGAITVASGVTLATSGTLRAAVAGATVAGAGQIDIGATGVVTADTLTNAGNISGDGGQLGDGHMVLINQAAGKILSDSGTLTVDTGASVITNAGTIGSDDGAMVIKSAVDNTGLLAANAQNLTVDGAVTGSGTVEVAGGTADFASTFSENVAFTAGGVLELAKSQSYTGQITGFAKTATTSLDLSDIAFGSKTKATFSGTTASGTLTVTDGTHTAKITLVGDYTASTFVAASDGHGGTLVHDPARATRSESGGAVARQVSALTSAAAGLGSTRAAELATRLDLDEPRRGFLSAAGFHGPLR